MLMPGNFLFSSAAAKLARIEKAHYPFRNYRGAHARSVLFVGCNVVSLYPRTVARAAAILRERAGVGVAFDCCGASLAMASRAGRRCEGSAFKVKEKVGARLSRAGVEELVTICPTCASALEGLSGVRVVNVYAKLRELGIGCKLPADGAVFPPCPDRKGEEWLGDVLAFFDDMPPVLRDVPCCGLGAAVSGARGDIPARMSRRCLEFGRGAAEGPLYVYCASCAGAFAECGGESVRFALSEILCVHERPQTASSFANRAKAGFFGVAADGESPRVLAGGIQ